MANLIHKAGCKVFLLDYAKNTRHHKFTRVSSEMWDWLEASLRTTMTQIIESSPSKGKTIYPPIRREKTQVERELNDSSGL